MQKELPTTFHELLQRYNEGERNFVGAQLDTDSENDASRLCLDDINLSQAFVFGNFRAASLRGACFQQANLKTCDFREADLTNADFRGAGLCSATFDGAILDGTNFEGAYIHSYVIKAGEKPDLNCQKGR
jgi:uncharacterized protein YjbI with pentapeptide repeats